MKKTFKMENLDCANCARKMQEAICKLDGINSCTVSFLTQKLTLDADDARFDELARQAAKCCARVDADCKVLL